MPVRSPASARGAIWASSASGARAGTPRTLTNVPDRLPISVTDIDSMFRGAVRFNQPLDTWNTASAVNDMRNLFDCATAFNQPLCCWGTSSVVWMQGMFLNASSFSRDLPNWYATNITGQPLDFDVGATAWVLLRPIWGTCPGGGQQTGFVSPNRPSHPIGVDSWSVLSP